VQWCEERIAGRLRSLRIGTATFRAVRAGMPVADALAEAHAAAAFREMSPRRATAFLIELGDDLMAKGETALALPLYRKAAEAGDHGAVTTLVNWPGVRDDPAAMEAVYRAAIAAGDVSSLSSLAMLRARGGDHVQARELYQQGIDAGDIYSLLGYGTFLRKFGAPGELAGTIAECRQRADDDSHALALLGALLLTSPDGEAEAETVLRRGAELLENRSRSLLAAMLLDRGAVGEGSDLVQRLRATGDERVRVFAEGLAAEYELHPASE
jgi:hypothetical protein